MHERARQLLESLEKAGYGESDNTDIVMAYVGL